MKVRRYIAPDMRTALSRVRDAQGPDVVILSNRSIKGGVELITADESYSRERDTEGFPTMLANAYANAETVIEPAEAPDSRQEIADAKRSGTEEPAEVLWTREPVLEQMRSELNALRGLVEQELAGLAWGDLGRRHPLRASMLRRLVDLGLDADLADNVVANLDDAQPRVTAWRQVLGLLCRRIPIANNALLQRGGVAALLGPTGVGKTTVIAKLAAQFALAHGSENVALITTDVNRIGAQDQLRGIGQILGIPVWTVTDMKELPQTLQALLDRRLVLIDTAGFSQRDARVADYQRMFANVPVAVHKFLVLSAVTQSSVLDNVARNYALLDAEGCILTKLDESTSLGPALSTAIRLDLPLTFVCAGQRIPEDLAPAVAHQLVARAVKLAGSAYPKPDDVYIEKAFSRELADAS